MMFAKMGEEECKKVEVEEMDGGWKACMFASSSCRNGLVPGAFGRPGLGPGLVAFLVGLGGKIRKIEGGCEPSTN